MLDYKMARLLTNTVRDARGRETCGFLMVDNGGSQQFIAAHVLTGIPDSFVVSAEEIYRIGVMHSTLDFGLKRLSTPTDQAWNYVRRIGEVCKLLEFRGS